MSIASRIQEIETHIGDVYDTINYSYDTTGVNKNIINIPKYLKKGYIDIINNGIDTLYNNFPKVSGIGSNLSLTPTYEAPMKLNEIQGSSLQDGTPTPDTPVPIQSVTGLQNIGITGKNLLNAGQESYVLPANENYSQAIGEIYLKANTKYYFSYNVDNDSASNTRSTMYLQIGTGNRIYQDAGTNKNLTKGRKVWEYTPTQSAIYNVGYWLHTSNVAVSIRNFMISTSTATTYEPYKGNTYEVNLGKNLLDSTQESYTLPANTTNYQKIWNTKPYLEAGTKYYISYNIDNASSSNTRSTPRLYLNQQYVQSSQTNQNLTTGRKVWEFTPTVSGNYEVQYWLQDSNVDVTVSKFMISKSSDTSYSTYFEPIELNKINTYQDSIKKSTGKNLFDKDNVNSLQAYFNAGATNTISTSANARTIYIPCKPNTTYTISKITSARFYVGYTNETPALGVEVFGRDGENNKNTPITITTGANATYIVAFIYFATSETLTLQQILDTIQIEENSQATSYEPYGKVWYVEKQIGKVVLDGTEDWTLNNNYTNNSRFTNNDDILNKSERNVLSNYFVKGTGGTDTTNIDVNGVRGKIMLTIPNSIATSVSNLTTWLSTHNTEVLYVLETPTYTEITNTELIEDLETLYTAKSQDGTTNISITSEDLEMILNISALKGDA